MPVSSHDPVLPRHSRVWLRPDVVCLADSTTNALVQTHVRRQLPFVARRRQPGDAGTGIPLGLRQPLGSHRCMLSFCVSQQALAKVEPALLLRSAVGKATFLAPQQQAWLLCLDETLNHIGVRARVYGSFAWQCASGDQHFTSQSDIDLIIAPQTIEQAQHCLAVLAQSSHPDMPHLDGEMLFPNGAAVAWRELLLDSSQVLAKTNTEAVLVQRSSLWEPDTWISIS